MKRLVLLITIAFSTITVMGQIGKKCFTIKPMLGVNVTTLGQATHSDMYHYKLRPTIGAEAEYSVNSWLGLSVGIMYSQQGAKIDYESAKTTEEYNGRLHYTKGTKTGNLYCDYINIPLMANVYISSLKGLSFKAGLQIGILVNDKADFKAEQITWIDIPLNQSVDLDYDGTKILIYNYSNFCKSVDFGIPFGLSYEFNHFTLDARYYYGLTKLDKMENGDTVRNRYLSITLGYRFQL